METKTYTTTEEWAEFEQELQRIHKENVDMSEQLTHFKKSTDDFKKSLDNLEKRIDEFRNKWYNK